MRVRKSHIDRRYVFSSKIETFPSPGYNEVNSYIEVRASVMCERKLSERAGEAAGEGRGVGGGGGGEGAW